MFKRIALLAACVVAYIAMSGCKVNLSNLVNNCQPGSTIQGCIDQLDAFPGETKEARVYGDPLKR